ncbi:MAG TPA: PD-(D/E)XK nuclease family protein [Aggregatilineales bacterium]|nr:PD-(D/E)XK nuclease family protein [Aggregatilineales bacterium]
MPATLLTAPAGHGKTRFIIDRILRLKDEQPLARVWVLLPTELQISAFRNRLMGRKAPIFGVEVFNFYELYTHLLDIAGIPQRRVKNGARFRVLRQVIDPKQLEHFDRIAATPGFIAVVERLIDELKQSRVTPEAFSAAATTPKDRDLAIIYSGYQDYLRRNNLADQEGEGWLALETLRKRPDLDLRAELLVVDGYDQFDRVQAELLALLGKRLPETILALTYEPERAATAHRRFAQTRERLLETGAWIEQPLPDHRPPRKSAALEYLAHTIFESDPGKRAADDALTLIEAPDRRAETAAVLRRVKRLLLDGIPPESIMIVSRDPAAYTAHFLEKAAAYGVPLATRGGLPLPENPAVGTLMALIGLADADFPRRATLDLLRSPYLRIPDLSDEQIASLDTVSRKQIVVRGRDTWLEAVRLSAHAGIHGDDEDDRVDADEAPLLTAAKAQTLYAALAAFFDRITPPPEAAARQYVIWLEGLIGPDPAHHEADQEADEEGIEFEADPGLRLLGQIRDAPDDGLRARDLIAMYCLQRVIADVLAAYNLVDPHAPVTWQQFRSDLEASAKDMRPTVTTNRLGRVLLASVYEARCLAHPHLFVVGLSEGEFPRPVPEDPLYTDSERLAMQGVGIPLLTRAQAADESSLFYEMTALAGESLTLSRPYIDDKGNEWPASAYWRAVEAIVDVPVIHLKIGGRAALHEAAQLSEALLAQVESLNIGLPDEAARVHNWLLGEHAQTWINALRGRWIEANRLSRSASHDEYTGRLTDPDLIAVAAQRLGPGRVWSASQFNEYGICPYRFFARRMLKLEELKEPEEGLDVLQFGTLVHDILERTYRQIGAENLAIRPENLERALAILDEQLADRLPGAPRRYGFRVTGLWEQEQRDLGNRLKRLIGADFADETPVAKTLTRLAGEETKTPAERRAYGQEIVFGDPEPLRIEGEAGALKVRGKIDRVDVAGNAAIVIDYKTGSSKYSTQDMVEGRNTQMMLYLLAAEQVLADVEPAAGMFWHVNTRETSGAVTADDPQIEEARANLHQRVIDGREGIFVSRPGKPVVIAAGLKCVSHCEFIQLCRVNRASRRKPVG